MRYSLQKCKWVKPDGCPTSLDMQEFLTIYFILGFCGKTRDPNAQYLTNQDAPDMQML